ncbi:signal recognition particle receptor subunit alpha [bacterium]|nr:signal recognition particle receptor subunit alpha [bacterium]
MPTIHLNTLQLAMAIAIVAQIPLLGLAFLSEFSARKRRPRRAAAPSAERPEAPKPTPAAVPAETVPAAARVEVATTVEVAIETTPPTAEAAHPVTTPSAPAAAPDAPAEAAAEVVVEAAQPAPVEEKTEAATPIAVIAATPTEQPEEAAPSAVAAPRPAPVRIGLGLRKTRENFLTRLRAAITGSAKADEIYEGLEEALIGADVGVEGSLKLVEAVRARLKNDARPDVIREALKDEIARVLNDAERPLADSGDAPMVIMMVGVNGVGKTTTVAKLAALLKAEQTPEARRRRRRLHLHIGDVFPSGFLPVSAGNVREAPLGEIYRRGSPVFRRSESGPSAANAACG